MMSLRYRTFLFFAFSIFIINLFVMNGFIPVWSNAEDSLILGGKEVMFGGGAPNFPAILVAMIGFRWEDPEILRFPGIALLLICLWGIFAHGRKIFGRDTMSLSTLVIISSFLITNVGKFATADIWEFSLQSMAVIYMILYLKQPRPKWHILHAVLTFFAALVQPVSTLVLILGFGLFLFFFHPNGKQLRKLWMWLPLYGLIGFLYYNGFPSFEQFNPFFFNYGVTGFGSYALWMLYGMLPWLAFLPAGLRHSIRRVRQKEEMAVILIGWLIASFFAMSLTLQLVFAILIAKQYLGFFHEKYPYHKLVKASSALHLVIVLIGASLLMIGGWYEMKGLGYRSMMVLGLIYWLTAMAGLLGVFMKNRKLIIGGMALSGLLATFIFWVQIFPLIELSGILK